MILKNLFLAIFILQAGILHAESLNKPVNIAKGAKTTPSSDEKAETSSKHATDGDLSTRWSSKYTNNEYIYLDLDSVQNINRVILYWETAYGKSYKIQVSTDGVMWTDIFEETNGNGDIDDIAFSGIDARYVKMLGLERGTKWGYSLYEFEVYKGCYVNAGNDINKSDYDGDNLEEITLSAIGSAAEDSSFIWSWDEDTLFGKKITLDKSVGIDTILLTVLHNSDFCTDNIIVTINPKPNDPPVAKGIEDITINIGDTVTFKDAGSYDEDGSIISKKWELVTTSNTGTFTRVEEMDDKASMTFAVMSDHWGRSPLTGWSDSTFMKRMDRWIKAAGCKFVLGLGDHMEHKEDTWDKFIAHPKEGGDPYWYKNFYPALADHDNEAYTGRQNAWGASQEILRVMDFKEKSNVRMVHNEPNKLNYGVEYYAWFEYNDIKIHWIALHFPDEYDGSQGGTSGFLEPSRQWMTHMIDSLYDVKTDKDIIIVGAHSWSGNFLDVLTKDMRKNTLKKADMVLSATMHQYRRHTYLDLENPPADANDTKRYPTDAVTDGAIVINTGAVLTGPIFGFMVVHVFKNPTRIAIQYHLTQNTNRGLVREYPTYNYSSGRHFVQNYSWLKYINGKTYPISNWDEVLIPNFELLAENKDSASYTFSIAGNYMVRLTVTDDKGARDIYETIVSVEDTSSTQKNIAVQQITVNGTANNKKITRREWPLQMRAYVNPFDATDKTVTWSVENGTGEALINSTGILTPVKNGTVTVKATANDGSEVFGQCIVSISGQPTSTTTGLKKVDEEIPIIFPNPAATNKVTFKGRNDIKRIFVFDQAGQAVKLVVGKNLNSLHINDLEPGAYYIKTFAAHHKIDVYKLLKQ